MLSSTAAAMAAASVPPAESTEVAANCAEPAKVVAEKTTAFRPPRPASRASTPKVTPKAPTATAKGAMTRAPSRTRCGVSVRLIGTLVRHGKRPHAGGGGQPAPPARRAGPQPVRAGAGQRDRQGHALRARGRQGQPDDRDAVVAGHGARRAVRRPARRGRARAGARRARRARARASPAPPTRCASSSASRARRRSSSTRRASPRAPSARPARTGRARASTCS